jgi:hypothetical protein
MDYFSGGDGAFPAGSDRSFIPSPVPLVQPAEFKEVDRTRQVICCSSRLPNGRRTTVARRESAEQSTLDRPNGGS